MGKVKEETGPKPVQRARKQMAIIVEDVTALICKVGWGSDVVKVLSLRTECGGGEHKEDVMYSICKLTIAGGSSAPFSSFLLQHVCLSWITQFPGSFGCTCLFCRHAIRIWHALCCLACVPPHSYKADVAVIASWHTCDVLNIGGAPIFQLFPTMGMCSGHTLWTPCLFLDISDFSDFPVLDSSVIGLTLLALSCVVTETQSLHKLEAQSSTRAPLHCHMCSQLHHPALPTED
jgi:hypothetical protein